MVRIREFEPPRDRPALRTCLIELQDFEHQLDPRKPPGEQVADAYLDLMLRRCRDFDGVVLVAEIAGDVIGFVTIWKRFRSSEPDDDPRQHGYVSDLLVRASHRGRGIGRSLLRAAEARAGEAGARSVRISVMAGNTAARSLYAAEGFVESEICLEKRLA
jgi:ribosomal protein S18 acetylase RimI-like enzyme